MLERWRRRVTGLNFPVSSDFLAWLHAHLAPDLRRQQLITRAAPEAQPGTPPPDAFWESSTAQRMVQRWIFCEITGAHMQLDPDVFSTCQVHRLAAAVPKKQALKYNL